MRRKIDSLLLAAMLAGGCLVPGCQKAGQRSDYQPRIARTVSSTQLVGTEIVPTLDTPLAETGNVVWCATFQVAWDRLCDDLIGTPLQIANAQVVANRMNNSPVTEAVLPSDSYFTAAGRLEDGIIATIRKEMTRQFPHAHLPNLEGEVGFVTYGYMETAVTFTKPFSDTEQQIRFSDTAGVAQPVSGFGLHQGTDWDLRAEQAAQVKILFSQTDVPTNNVSDGARLSAFALDLTADQTEQQVIVAVLPRAEHLRAILDDLAMKIAKFAPDDSSERLQAIDSLAIPNVAFEVDHEFDELEGDNKLIETPGEFQGLHIQTAAQSIHFRLDKSGATVISESYLVVGATPRYFVVDRPFLIVMKRRSSDEPYFAAWIGNAEFLEVN
ncbi:MAG: hypothetical protein IT423_05990 [Pirellulaceae bacterium]|nr:hypothetical protein [Pirellulaceae bacterium]